MSARKETKGPGSEPGRGRCASTRPLPVTVVVPAYNRERVLRETLATIAVQSRLPSEVVIVDDGSVDATVGIAEAWARETESGSTVRVRVIAQANAGAAAARNRGLREGRQPWVAFLDSDDLWAPEKLEQQWKVLEADPSVTCVFTDMTQFRESGEVVTASFLARYANYRRVQRRRLFPSAFRLEKGSLARQFLAANFINPSTLLVFRDLLEQVGPMVEGLAPCEDREFLLRLLNTAETAVLERPLVHYRMHASNISSDSVGMALCTAELARMIEQAPERYIEGAAKAFLSRRPGLLQEAGIHSLRKGRFDQGRKYLWQSLSEAWSLKSLLWLFIAWGGPRPYSFLARLRHLGRVRGRRREAERAEIG